jgi:hypothetical protein
MQATGGRETEWRGRGERRSGGAGGGSRPAGASSTDDAPASGGRRANGCTTNADARTRPAGGSIAGLQPRRLRLMHTPAQTPAWPHAAAQAHAASALAGHLRLFRSGRSQNGIRSSPRGYKPDGRRRRPRPLASAPHTLAAWPDPPRSTPTHAHATHARDMRASRTSRASRASRASRPTTPDHPRPPQASHPTHGAER